MFKRIVLIGVAVAVLVSGGLVSAWFWGQGASPAAAQSTTAASEYNPAQTITVLGQGTVQVEPDIARLSVGVETSAETISAAVTENETKMESILAALQAVGVDEKDIQTMNYSIQQDRYPEPMPRASGPESEEPQPVYRVSNMVNVTIRNLDTVGDVLDAVVDAGANSIWGVSFGLDDLATAQAEARADAVNDALARAQALAELNGVELGPVMSVSEVIGGGVVPMSVTMERTVAGGGAISPGELEIGYQVQVSYFIEP